MWSGDNSLDGGIPVLHHQVKFQAQVQVKFIQEDEGGGIGNGNSKLYS